MICTYSKGYVSATGIEASMTYRTRNTFGRVHNLSGKQLYAVLDLCFDDWHDCRIECADRSALVMDGIVTGEKQC
jgi:hypothetical protein